MHELAGLTALIIEPHAGMRTSIHGMLTMSGLTRIEYASTSNQAVKQLGLHSYDVVLCEYDLEGGQDGQQLLEDLRQHRLMPLSTIFIMVTAEGNHKRVVSAAELAPTDYILKPFTAERLLERIGRALKKRNAFRIVHALIDAGDPQEAINACLAGEVTYPQYALDFMRLRAELHMVLGQPELAEPIYQALVDMKAIAWARLGLAKTLFVRKRFEDSREMLGEIVEEHRSFVDAYDWLARTHAALGEAEQAQQVLAAAVAVSPHAVQRLRTLAETAYGRGDTETAEKVQRQVISKAKYSEFRDPEDHVRLVRTLIERGDAASAAGVVRDLERSMAGRANVKACAAIAAAMVHEASGDKERQRQCLLTAITAARDNPTLSTDLKLELARRCLAYNMHDEASEVVRDVMCNAADESVMARAIGVMAEAGQGEQAQQLARESRQVVMDLLADGASRARQGDYEGAVEMMLQARSRMPDNPAVAFNAALAVLRCLEHGSWSDRVGAQAVELIGHVRALDPRNAKLPALAALHRRVLQQHGRAPQLGQAA